MSISAEEIAKLFAKRVEAEPDPQQRAILRQPIVGTMYITGFEDGAKVVAEVIEHILAKKGIVLPSSFKDFDKH